MASYDRTRVFIDPLGEYLDGFRQAEADEIKAQLAYRQARAADQEFAFRAQADPLKIKQLEAQLDATIASTQVTRSRLGSSASAARGTRRTQGRTTTGAPVYNTGRYTTSAPAADPRVAPAAAANNVVDGNGQPVPAPGEINPLDLFTGPLSAGTSDDTRRRVLEEADLTPGERAAIEATLGGQNLPATPTAPSLSQPPVRTIPSAQPTALPPLAPPPTSSFTPEPVYVPPGQAEAAAANVQRTRDLEEAAFQLRLQDVEPERRSPSSTASVAVAPPGVSPGQWVNMNNTEKYLAWQEFNRRNGL